MLAEYLNYYINLRIQNIKTESEQTTSPIALAELRGEMHVMREMQRQIRIGAEL